MNTPFDGVQVWFLTGSQGLYGEDVLGQVAAQSQRVSETLNASGAAPVAIVWKPVLTDSESIRRAMLDAATDDSCLGVIAWMHTFSPAKMWIRGLDLLSKPLLQLHTQANVELPWSSIDMDFMNLNQAAHGDREFGYILSRVAIPRKVVVGHATDARVQQEIGTWVRAATGYSTMRSLRLARFGDNMRNVAVTEGDKVEAEVKLGVSVNSWGINDLAGSVADVFDAEIDVLVKEYEQLYDVAPELRRDGDRHESLRYGARLELGLRAFLEDGGFGAFTTNFEDLGPLRQLPGLAVQRLMADGYGFGAEGDWKTAILVRAAKAMGHGLPGGASLMEDYTYHLTPGSELILGAHMLEVCPTLSTGRPRLEVHPLGIGNREDPVRLIFSADPGPGLVVAMSDLRDRFRLVANVVDVVEPPHAMPRLPVAHAVWKPRPDLPTSAAAWLQAGAAHHTVLTTALDLATVKDLARLTGIELLTIDSHTAVDGFERELRWNAAYHRIAGGV